METEPKKTIEMERPSMRRDGMHKISVSLIKEIEKD